MVSLYYLSLISMTILQLKKYGSKENLNLTSNTNLGKIKPSPSTNVGRLCGLKTAIMKRTINETDSHCNHVLPILVHSILNLSFMSELIVN